MSLSREYKAIDEGPADKRATERFVVDEEDLIIEKPEERSKPKTPVKGKKEA